MSRIGVAISGGGHRAALFGLGALMYLVDAGKNKDVTSIASVSGGSLTNGFVAQTVDFTKAEPDQFDAKIKDLVGCIAQRGTVLPPDPFTLAYLILVGLLALAGLVGVWWLPIPVGVRVVVFLAALLLMGYVAGLRGRVAAKAFASRLFSPTGTPTRLDAICTSLDHVICATNLHWGENVYFSGSFVSSFRFGWGEPGGLPLHVAVQASAALPGPFPPRWLPKAQFRFQHPVPEASKTSRLVLVDGGVYDNQADEWVLGMDNRRRRFGSLLQGVGAADELIAVNASGGLGYGSTMSMRLPLLGELLALLRDKSILYDNGNSIRRELMVARFTHPESARDGLRGALVHIPRSPLWVASRYEHSQDPAYAQRAQALLAVLRPDEQRWEQLASRAAHQPTSLSKLGVQAATDLLEHAYVLAMANLHVILGYPLLALPDRARFEALGT